MKKLLSIVLVLLMVFAAVACTATPGPLPEVTQNPTEAPKAEEPAPAVEPEPVAEAGYQALALNIKNKTGKTINEVYIYAKGAEKGNSVVEAGWKDKDADGDNYEKNIYIVREAGAEFEMFVVFDDATNLTFDLGALAMYDKLSMKGATAEDLKHEPNDDAADIAAMNLLAAVGKTSDNYYPGYVLIPVELKNKTGKAIKELYFYEEGGNPKTYNNLIDYLYTDDGVKMDSLMSGKAKEGGKYLFKCFIRPLADNYMIDVAFDDGATITYPIEDWFKADGSGNLPNEISLKNAEDPDDIKVQYDDGVPEPIDYLAESVQKGHIVDQWYPVYATVEADAAEVEAARTELAKLAVPAPEETAEPAVPEQPVEPAAEVPEGYTGLHLMLKNKSGKEIYKVYLFPNGEDKGKNIFKEVVKGNIPTEDDGAEGKPHEVFAYVLRETAKLEAMTLRVRYADETEQDFELKPLEDYTVFTVKADEFKQKVSDDAEDMAAMNAVAAAGKSTDGVEPVAEETAEVAEAPVPEAAAGYTALALNIKNKTGVTVKAVYLYVPGAEDKGQSVVAEGWKDKDADGDNYEKNIYVIRPEGVLTVELVAEDGTVSTREVELKMYDKISFKGVAAEDWKIEANDDPADIAAMDELVAGGVTSDNWYPAA